MAEAPFIYGVCRVRGCDYLWTEEYTEGDACPACDSTTPPMPPAEADFKRRSFAKIGSDCPERACKNAGGRLRECPQCTERDRAQDSNAPRALACNQCGTHFIEGRKLPRR